MTNIESLDDGFSFRFATAESRTLRSVAVVNGVPEFRFDPSPKVPALTEEDVAVALRLAQEGKRPEFFYIPIAPHHPFYGRQYKQYLPEWLEGTSIGETLSESDWGMKCLNIGARSNESKSVFHAWEKTSRLKGLATSTDFPDDNKYGGSVIMSCKSMKIRRKGDEEIEFAGEPRLHINYESSLKYTRYINRVLPSVAHHDEPLFLKVGEILKLIVAAEWMLKEKGVKISQRWLEEHCNKPRKTLALPASACAQTSAIEEPSTLDLQLVPEAGSSLLASSEVMPPRADVSMKRSEAKRCKPEALKRKESSSRYGYYDHGSHEMVVFEADGTPYTKMSSLKTYGRHLTIVDGRLAEVTEGRVNIPFLEDVMNRCGKELDLQQKPENSSSTVFSGSYGPFSMDVKVTPNGKSGEVTLSESDSCSQPHVKTIVVVRSTADDNYDMLYKGNDPNVPLRPNIPGLCEAIVPNVKSWNELYSKTVPWPRVWQLPYEGEGVSTATGGVTTRNIPVVYDDRERRVMEDTARSRHEGRSVVRGVRTIEQQKGTIREIFGDDLEGVVGYFNGAWHPSKGACPAVKKVFEVTNDPLRLRWEAYGRGLPQLYQGVEKHFHGTALTCNIFSTRALCRDTGCGICGISNIGLDPQRIQTNIPFQRFGNGYYLAPQSSKCHDYIKENPLGHRAMLLCNVLPGKKYTTDRRVNGPIPGYDSVGGEEGGELNYPEIVLYKPEAVMPRYIIVY